MLRTTTSASNHFPKPASERVFLFLVFPVSICEINVMKKITMPGVELFNADCLCVLKNMPDDSVDLIVTDPPYFKVNPVGWDNQWKGDADYLRWLDCCLAEFWRVLKPNGSLYLFSGHRLASDIEIMMRERFNILNHIIWAKPFGW